MQILICHPKPADSPRLEGLMTGFLQSGHHVRLLPTDGGRLATYLRRRRMCQLIPPDLIYEFGRPANAAFARRHGHPYALDLESLPEHVMPDLERLVISSDAVAETKNGTAVLGIADGIHPAHALPSPFGAPVADRRASWQDCAAAIVAFATP